MMVHYDPEFYRGKRVFVTGHTGFKGSWLCKMLLMAGPRSRATACSRRRSRTFSPSPASRTRCTASSATSATLTR